MMKQTGGPSWHARTPKTVVVDGKVVQVSDLCETEGLRQLVRNPNLRLRWCRIKGQCPHLPHRCTFIHAKSDGNNGRHEESSIMVGGERVNVAALKPTKGLDEGRRLGVPRRWCPQGGSCKLGHACTFIHRLSEGPVVAAPPSAPLAKQHVDFLRKLDKCNGHTTTLVGYFADSRNLESFERLVEHPEYYKDMLKYVDALIIGAPRNDAILQPSCGPTPPGVEAIQAAFLNDPTSRDRLLAASTNYVVGMLTQDDKDVVEDFEDFTPGAVVGIFLRLAAWVFERDPLDDDHRHTLRRALSLAETLLPAPCAEMNKRLDETDLAAQRKKDSLVVAGDEGDERVCATHTACPAYVLEKLPPIESCSILPDADALFDPRSVRDIQCSIQGIVVHRALDEATDELHRAAQFHLMREDVVASLRSSISVLMKLWPLDPKGGHSQIREHLRANKRIGINRISYFPEVTFVAPEVHRFSGLLFNFTIPISTKVRMNWAKKLMSGNVIALADQKKGFGPGEPLFVGTVRRKPLRSKVERPDQPANRFVNRENAIDPLEQCGEFWIEFNDASDFLEHSFQGFTQFVMVESSSFFLPYERVLTSLQNQCGKPFMPLMKPILTGVTGDAPQYIQRCPTLDVGSMVAFELGRNASINVLDDAAWAFEQWTVEREAQFAARKEHCALLDGTQGDAIKHIFKNRVAVVQGTPGTGKSFLGAKFAQILLHNYRSLACGPILVVTFTNHALDAFLGDVLAFGTQKDHVARVGGRSKDEKIRELQLERGRFAGIHHFAERQKEIEDIAAKQKLLLDGVMVTPDLERCLIDVLKSPLHVKYARQLDETWQGQLAELRNIQHRINEKREEIGQIVRDAKDCAKSKLNTMEAIYENVHESVEKAYANANACAREAASVFTDDDPNLRLVGETLVVELSAQVSEIQEEIGQLTSDLVAQKAYMEQIKRRIQSKEQRQPATSAKKGKKRRGGKGALPSRSAPLADCTEDKESLQSATADYESFQTSLEDLNVKLARAVKRRSTADKLMASRKQSRDRQSTFDKIKVYKAKWETSTKELAELVTKVTKFGVNGEKTSFLEFLRTRDGNTPMRPLKETLQNAPTARGNEMEIGNESDAVDKGFMEEQMLEAMERREMSDLVVEAEGDVAQMEIQPSLIPSDEKRKWKIRAVVALANGPMQNPAEPLHRRHQAANEVMEGLVEEAVYQLCDKLKDIFKSFASSKERIRRDEENSLVSALSSKHIIGGTTVGISQILNVVRNIGVKVVIVEEAAEVLESHVLACLTENVEHLVLIGDHKQLKPKVTENYLEVKKNLGVSLMERLALIKAPLVTLTMQRRMHPKISALVKNYYATDKNHPSIIDDHPRTLLRRCPVGVAGSPHVLLLSYEATPSCAEVYDQNLDSPKNEHEACMVLCMADYLHRMNKDMSITILVPYIGQRFEVVRQSSSWCPNLIYSSKKPNAPVKLVTVDEFQGDEDDIIIISLTRTEKPGFLNIENRACVALSRARSGLYIIGCDTILDATTNPLWKTCRSICEEEYQSAVRSFDTCCPVHGDTMSFTSCDEYKRLKSCKCQKSCAMPLSCGHTCQLACHGGDHNSYKCEQPCSKTKELCHPPRTCNHPCGKKCKDDCGPCTVIVGSLCEQCGYTSNVKCCDLSNKRCLNRKYTAVADCGHEVTASCEEHTAGTAHRLCTHPCTEKMPCGHECYAKCHFGSDMDHSVMKMNCQKVKRGKGPCGHEMNFECCIEGKTPEHFPPCTEACGKRLDHFGESHCCAMPCGHREPCKCAEERESRLECGHVAKHHCQDKVSAVNCKKPCTETLSCGHRCDGSCGVCSTRRYHHCSSKCSKTLICGHRCNKDCAAQCTRCEAVCTFQCDHGLSCAERNSGKHHCSECKAWRCQEDCAWRCPHAKCDLRCYEPCKRNVCDLRCELKLPCGHQCLGLCGEKCPQFCAMCDYAPLSAQERTLLISDKVLLLASDDEDIHLSLSEEHEQPIDPMLLLLQLPCCKKFMTVGDLHGHVKARVESAEGVDVEISSVLCPNPECARPLMPSALRRCGSLIKQRIIDCREAIDKEAELSLRHQQSAIEVVKSTTKSICDLFADEDIATRGKIAELMERFEELRDTVMEEPPRPPPNPPKLNSKQGRVQHEKKLADHARLVGAYKTKLTQYEAERVRLEDAKISTQRELEKHCGSLVLPNLLMFVESLEEYIEQKNLGKDSKVGLLCRLVYLMACLDRTSQLQLRHSPSPVSNGCKREQKNIQSSRPFSLDRLSDIKKALSGVTECEVMQAEWALLAFRVLPSARDGTTVASLEFPEAFMRDILVSYKELALTTPSTFDKLAEDRRSAPTERLLEAVSNSETWSKAVRMKFVRQIAAAIGLNVGHAFKCPKGHYFFIGECGGAMQRSRCPDCNAVIGGEDHQTVAGVTNAAADFGEGAAWGHYFGVPEEQRQ